MPLSYPIPTPLVGTFHSRWSNVRATENGMDASPRRPETNFNCRQDAGSTLLLNYSNQICASTFLRWRFRRGGLCRNSNYGPVIPAPSLQNSA